VDHVRPPYRVRFFFVSAGPGHRIFGPSRDGAWEMVQVIAQKLQGIHRAPLEAAIAPVLSSHGVDTVEVSYQMEPSGWVLRVIVESLARAQSEGDGADAAPFGPPGSEAIDLGLLAEISRDLSSALDVADIIPHRYHLEVSSPGLDRPLRAPRDYQRALGQVAKIRLLHPAADGQKVLRGRILEASDQSVSVEVDGKPVTTRLDNVERAHLIFELPARPKGGHAKPGKPKKH
jgi:ribosome maturation factor RimP